MQGPFQKDGPKRRRHTRRQLWRGEGEISQYPFKEFRETYSPRSCLRGGMTRPIVHPTVTWEIDQYELELLEDVKEMSHYTDEEWYWSSVENEWDEWDEFMNRLDDLDDFFYDPAYDDGFYFDYHF